MILTEEQRAAIKLAMKYIARWPFAYKELHARGVLQAMIDSSEHFTDATKLIGFDLERAREAIEEDVDRLSQKIGDEDGPIWEKEPEKAAVLQTLPDEIAHLEKWMIKNRDAATELQYQLDDAIKENERLRSAIKTYREREESAFSEIKMKDEFLMRQNARIKELEDAHKRSGAKYAKIINELRSSVYANIPGLKKQWDEILNAPANGKIGPDADAKPHCWQITEERKAAIKELSELLTAIGCPSCHYYIQKNYGEDITVLRAMLTEAE